MAFFLRGIFLFGWIHPLAIDFVVPPSETEVGCEHVGARVHVADHALAGGNGASKGVLYRMARLRFIDRWISGSARPGMAKCRVRTGVRGIAIVGVYNVAGRATASPIVAGMIVGSGQGHHGI